MARNKYLMIRINWLYAISGICKNKITYGTRVSKNIDDNSICKTDYLPIYLKADGFPKLTYTELVTERKFVIKSRPNLESRIEAIDKSCCSEEAVYISNDYGVDDYRDVIAYFQNLKKNNLYEEYIKKVDEVFRFIDTCKKMALDGRGKVEDSVEDKEYFGGIGHDAKRILQMKNENKGERK